MPVPARNARFVEAVSGGASFPIEWKARADLTNFCRIDVDRLGVIALHATARMLEMAHLGLNDGPRPSIIIFKCTHGVSRESAAMPVSTPTFRSREPSDKRVRKADRLRAGEILVKAFARHLKANSRVSTLEVLAAPLRLYDWQHIAIGLRTNGCPLRHLSLAGSAVGDAGLSALGTALLAHPTLITLNLNGCGLTTASATWLVRLLQASNQRQKRGRLLAINREWASGLCGGREAGWPSDPRDASKNSSIFDEQPDVVGLAYLGLAGNTLGEEGAQVRGPRRDCF